MVKKPTIIDDALDVVSESDEAIVQVPKQGEAEDGTDMGKEVLQDVPPALESAGRRSGLSVLLGLVLGGVIAAGIGFYAARYVVPEGWPFPGVVPEPDPLAVEQVDQANRIASLEAQMALQDQALGVIAADQTASELATALGQTEDRLTGVIELLNTVDVRLLEVEKIPQGSGTEAAEAAAAAYERELVAMREMLADALVKIETAGSQAQAIGQDAEVIAEQAQVSASLAQLRIALDNGQPFEAALDGLGVEVPLALLQASKAGVLTQSALQDAFPGAARAALDASIAAQIEDGSVGRIAGFMRRQLGTRSLEPREGDDPDAVLSRTEGALKQGLLADALAQITGLPEVGQAAMADWVTQAQSRLDVLEAADALTMMLNTE